MAKPPGDCGQTLVELAIVLPCFCLGIFMGLQLIWYCHNMVELQRMAQVMADRQSYQNYMAAKKYTLRDSMWGRFSAPWAYFKNQRIASWRPFKGESTVQAPGLLLNVHVDSDLLPGDGFSSVLARRTQQAYAETYWEPPVPSEN